jgi:hypothetical protein
MDMLEINSSSDLSNISSTVKETLARPNFLYVDCDMDKIKRVEKLIKKMNRRSKMVVAENAEDALVKLKVLNNNFDIIIVAEQLSLDGFLGHEFVEGIEYILYYYYY